MMKKISISDCDLSISTEIYKMEFHPLGQDESGKFNYISERFIVSTPKRTNYENNSKIYFYPPTEFSDFKIVSHDMPEFAYNDEEIGQRLRWNSEYVYSISLSLTERLSWKIFELKALVLGNEMNDCWRDGLPVKFDLQISKKDTPYV